MFQDASVRSRSWWPLMFDLGHEVIQREMRVQLLTFLGVVAVTGRELVDEAHRVDDADFVVQHLERGLSDFGQGPGFSHRG